jgi:hypothetical protein
VVGFALDRLPGGSDLLLHRYIIGVHFAGMLLGGIGLVWAFRAVCTAGRFVLRIPGRRVVAGLLACALGVVAMWPVLHDRDRYAGYDRAYITEQVPSDNLLLTQVNSLIDIAKQRGGGRLYAGLPSNWGSTARIGQVSLLELLVQRDVDSLGFTLRTDSLSQDIEAYFNETNPAQYDLFNVKYVLLPANREPAVEATQIAKTSGYTLWEVKGVSGYLEVVDTTEPVVATRKDMAAVMTQPAGGYLASSAVVELRHPLVAFDGRKTPPPSTSVSAQYTGPPGQVDSSTDSLDNGRFAGTVTASRDAWVMLKESYAPHWRATVDGKPVKTAMLAPSFIGVPVPKGTHTVVFQYHSDTKYPLYVAFGVLTLLAIAVGPLMWRRRRGRTRTAPAAIPEPA